MKHCKGFTLIELLVVIAIIAVLVAVIIQIASRSTFKAKAATDLANMRSVLGALNVLVIDHKDDLSDTDLDNLVVPPCNTFPAATLMVEYCASHYIRIYFVTDGFYYGIDYFAAIAETGRVNDLIDTSEPEVRSGVTWLALVS